MTKTLKIHGNTYMISQDSSSWYSITKQIKPIGTFKSCCELIADMENMNAAEVADLIGCDLTDEQLFTRTNNG